MAEDSVATRSNFIRAPEGKMYLQSGSKTFVARYAPQIIEYDMDIDDWSEVPRTQDRPITSKSSRKLRKFSCELTLAADNARRQNVQGQLDALYAIGQTGQPIDVIYDKLTGAWQWVMTNYHVSSSVRARNNEINRATVQLEFTQHVDDLTGVASTGSPTMPKTVKSTRKDNTLRLIAQKYGIKESVLLDLNGRGSEVWRAGVQKTTGKLPPGTTVRLRP